MSALVRYMEAWLANDPSRIAEAVAEDCTIIECYGPVYRGRSRVRECAEQWRASGGIVHGWSLTDHIVVGDREAAQWTFECTWGGIRSSFDGATMARSTNGLILELREYCTTEPLYEWTGASRKACRR